MGCAMPSILGAPTSAKQPKVRGPTGRAPADYLPRDGLTFRRGADLVTDPVRIMGIYAPPADVATEAAGTMAIHADRGDVVTCLVMSDGIRMHPHYPQSGAGHPPRTLAGDP